MSYILEALRKSEKERRMGQLPRLHNAMFSSQNRQKKTLWWLVLVSIGLLLLGFILSSLIALMIKPSVSVHSVQEDNSSASPVITQSGMIENEEISPSVNESVTEQKVLDYINSSTAQSTHLPPLNLDVISFAKVPEQRFVMINQKIYKTG